MSKPDQNYIPANPRPVLSAAQAKALLVAAIDSYTLGILGAYPQAERLGWDAKAAEAQAVLTASPLELDMAPLLTAECAAQFGPASDEDRQVQLVFKAQSVAEKASAWGALMATLSGLRARVSLAIDAAKDADEIRGVLEQALAGLVGSAPG